MLSIFIRPYSEISDAAFRENNMEILYGAKNGIHAFGYNSAESELIWMKSGTV